MSKIGRFDAPAWDGPRVPDPDPALDEERRRLYWEWLEAAPPWPDDAPAFAGASGDRRWVRLETGPQADYEARHMRHSLGHSFEHYGALGPMFSLRDAGNLPGVTILVSGGTVVHARRAENAPLAAADLLELRALARAQGWDVLPEDRL